MNPAAAGVMSFLDADVGEAPGVEHAVKRKRILAHLIDIVKGSVSTAKRGGLPPTTLSSSPASRTCW